MDILIVDQCSGDKSYPEQFRPFTEEQVDSQGLETLRRKERVPKRKARDLYTGRQQQFITEAVERLRSTGDSVDRYFISAGFGVVEEMEVLPPYDVTFTGKTAAEIQTRGERLNIEEDLRELVQNSYDIIFLSLGSDYYRSFDLRGLSNTVPKETWLVCFNCEELAAERKNVVSIPARTEQAREQGTIVVALKGRYLQNFAEHRAAGTLPESIDELAEYCMDGYTTQSELGQYDE
jgi:hypothetical protein